MSMLPILWRIIRTTRHHGTRSTAVEVVGEDAPRSPGGHRANVWRRIRPLDTTRRVPARRVGDRARPHRAGHPALDGAAGRSRDAPRRVFLVRTAGHWRRAGCCPEAVVDDS